jgi:hypothetical protein
MPADRLTPDEQFHYSRVLARLQYELAQERCLRLGRCSAVKQFDGELYACNLPAGHEEAHIQLDPSGDWQPTWPLKP